ncbi:uncharacterized protein CELE_Y40C7B.4 [Caenorhabditis elegans]|uniref:Uncharacterized protein n=1 Tax=Caenorhabditis elegans TaxID=6239 RepID=Q9N509_CAEEL|nr:Uncharacterized protein CELE_Y40C7B.4 [Caenorhabditis elegans]CCD66503.1 Uncharacterized protein CELE_Y40C7B.4 [Caenorhabditis elegans]|eukprot:NP_510798.1 Uncharacterized protein CELE_Y40C7B.4 [Caenorhabditis elegans]
MSDVELKYEYPLHVADPENLTIRQQVEVNKRQNEADRIKKMISKRDALIEKLRVLDEDIKNEVARMNARREAYDNEIAIKMRREGANLNIRKRKLIENDNRLDNEADVIGKKSRALEKQNVIVQPSAIATPQPAVTPEFTTPTSDDPSAEFEKLSVHSNGSSN